VLTKSGAKRFRGTKKKIGEVNLVWLVATFGFPIMRAPHTQQYPQAIHHPLLMKKDWVLTEEAFNLLLSWLASDREIAAKKYEDLRHRLIQIYYNRGCPVAEDLADETFNRVTRRLPVIIGAYVGAPAAYIHTTAHNVFLDYLKQRGEPLPDEAWQRAQPADDGRDKEELSTCLERCLARMTPPNRELVLAYYQENKQAKIIHRKQLAEQLGMAVNALRIRLCRLRTSLQQCIEACLENAPHTDMATADEITHEMD
jgi:RNA polymerase sigma factor (sigma-70 family)